MIVGFQDYKNNYEFKVTGIIHVGAHVGQEYNDYIQHFGSVPIFWFEPIPEVFEQLKANLSDKPQNYLYNMALGESESTGQIHVDKGNEGQSSLILNPKEHLTQFPHIIFDESNKVTIQINRLDNIDTKEANMLVLDTQGYELHVLKGAISRLQRIDYVFTEFNTVEMYEGCPTIDDLDAFLIPFGFNRRETWYTSQNWGDALYIKNKPSLN